LTIAPPALILRRFLPVPEGFPTRGFNGKCGESALTISSRQSRRCPRNGKRRIRTHHISHCADSHGKAMRPGGLIRNLPRASPYTGRQVSSDRQVSEGDCVTVRALSAAFRERAVLACPYDVSSGQGRRLTVSSAP